MLADMGAEVCKVENPKSGDLSRGLGAFYDNTEGERLTTMYACTNRGKKSIAIDSKTKRGRELVLALAAKADVFMQNWRPGVAEKLGVDYTAVRKVNPKIVYLTIDGFGPTGPDSKQKVSDPVIQARLGVPIQQAAVWHEPTASGNPVLVQPMIMDKATSFTACQSVLAALLARERRGIGQHLRVSMLDVGASYVWPDADGGYSALADMNDPRAGKTT
jgi:crotonobetainyl-CoA:carnitine CoA-transferase CaiB-like acyl-CoA transferase